MAADLRDWDTFVRSIIKHGCSSYKGDLAADTSLAAASTGTPGDWWTTSKGTSSNVNIITNDGRVLHCTDTRS